MFADLQIPGNYFEGSTLFRGRGCDRCNNTGYSGRAAILEAMTVTDEIRKLIIGRASAMEIGKVAMAQGMKPLRTAALERVREGLTTLEQTLVVTAAH
jgi:type IV pilus assembly protein PilB